jgi:anti-sigma factor RsiW
MAGAIAAVLTLMICAGMTGWTLGRGGASQGNDEFVARSYDNFVALPRALRQAAAEQTEPMNWLSQKLSLTLRAPDLSEQGYSIVDTRTVEGSGLEDMLRITYAGDKGRNFSLFLYPRWQKDSLSIQMVREGDVSLAYWLEGPLASVIASRLPPGELRAVSEAVRRSLNDPAATRPELGPAPAAGGKVAGGLVQSGDSAAALPESVKQGTMPAIQDIRPN